MKKLKFYTFGIIAFLLFSANAMSQQTAHYNTRVGSKITGFYDYLPPGYANNPSKKYPVYIVLQGISQLGNGSPEQLPWLLGVWGSPPWLINNGKWPGTFTVNGESFGFIVFTPQFSSAFGANDVKEAIDYCVSHYRVDQSRIYLSGISMGGGALWDYLASSVDYAKRVAAAIPISGSSGPSQSRANVIAYADVPVWATTASQDPVVSPSTTIGWVNDINGAPSPPNPRAKLTVFPVSEPTHSEATATTYSLTFNENGLNIYQWMLQYNRQSPLPVTGFNLSGRQSSSGDVTLSWKTEQEINNAGFTVQRSADGQNFNSLSFISSKSVNNGGSNYVFADDHPLAGANYYRIEQKDNDGRTSYSNVVYIDAKANHTSLRIFPNPVSSVLHIETGTPFLNAKILIRNVQGQLIKQLTLSGSGNLMIPVSDLAPGYYSARIINGEKEQNISFIKK